MTSVSLTSLQVAIPWVMVAAKSVFQFGLLWNIPAYGSVDFGSSDPATQVWTAYNQDQLDIFLTTYGSDTDPTGCGAARDILSHYVDAVGHAPEIPEWATGWSPENNAATFRVFTF